MVQHTPGPWTVTRREDGVVEIRATVHDIESGLGRSVPVARDIWGPPLGAGVYDEPDANARLIAAAPQMLETLLVAERVLGMLTVVLRPSPGRERVERTLEKVRAAITAATGRTWEERSDE